MNERYDTITRILHWVMAIAFIGLCCVGLYMADLPKEDPMKGTLVGLHKATGTLMLLLAFVRLAWSPRHKIALPDVIQGWERTLATAVKHLLYLMILLVPLSGFLMSHAAGRTISMFGLFDIPALMEQNRELAGMLHEAHEILAFTLIALIAVHVAGAIQHRLSPNKEEDVLQRML